MLSKDARRDVAGTNGKKARPQHSVWGVATLERTQDRSKNSPVAFLSLKGEGGYFSAVAFRQVASRLLSVGAGQGLAVVYFGHLEPKVEADGKAKGSRLLISQAYPAKSSAQVTPTQIRGFFTLLTAPEAKYTNSGDFLLRGLLGYGKGAVPFSFWGEEAYAIADTLDKGAKVWVEGTLREEGWAASEGEKKRYELRLRVASMLPLADASAEGEKGESPSGRQEDLPEFPDDLDLPF